MALEDMKDILDDFENSMNESRARIPENIFNEVFKPVFEGRVEENRDRIEKWVELAGSPYSEVDLIGEEGVVVATVSGILVPIDKDQRDGYKNILDRFSDSASLLRINPVKAGAMIKNGEAAMEQGILPSNAKSREYITYHNQQEAITPVAKKEEDFYSF